MGDEQHEEGKGQFVRRFVLPEQHRWPILVDYTALVFDEHHFTQSVFRTEVPLPDVPRGEIESQLAGRFAYHPGHFREVLRLFIRQWIGYHKALRGDQGEKEAIDWLTDAVNTKGVRPKEGG